MLAILARSIDSPDADRFFCFRSIYKANLLDDEDRRSDIRYKVMRLMLQRINFSNCLQKNPDIANSSVARSAIYFSAHTLIAHKIALFTPQSVTGCAKNCDMPLFGISSTLTVLC